MISLGGVFDLNFLNVKILKKLSNLGHILLALEGEMEKAGLLIRRQILF